MRPSATFLNKSIEYRIFLLNSLKVIQEDTPSMLKTSIIEFYTERLKELDENTWTRSRIINFNHFLLETFKKIIFSEKILYTIKTIFLKESKILNIYELQNNYGCTILQYAIDNSVTVADNKESLDLVKILLESGANPNTQDKYNDTAPLHKAVIFGNLDLVKILLESGANPNLKDRYGQTTVQICKNKEILKILLKGKQISTKIDTKKIKAINLNAPEASTSGNQSSSSRSQKM